MWCPFPGPGAARVSGFTLRGGVATNGGGVQVTAGAHELDSLLIIDCGALLRGSAINVAGDATPNVHHNILWECFDTDLEHGDGVVAGGANNILAEERHGDEIYKRGITYAPDFIANAGGVINISQEANGYDWQKAAAAVDAIGDSITKVFEIADREEVDTATAAIRLAEYRIAEVGGLNTRFGPGGEL